MGCLTRSPSVLRIDKHSRIEHALRIEFSFCCPQRRREKLRTMTIVPGSMVPADGVMMRDRAARFDQRVAGGVLDGLPLFQKGAVAAECVEGKIGCRPVRIDMGEAAC